MSKTDKVDVKNFMGVLKATEQTADGIRFPGRYMPSGKPVTSTGVTKAQLMTDKGMAMTWHDSIVGTYEREENQRNHESRKADTPELVIRGADANASEPRGSRAPAPAHTTSIEAQLQARREELATLIPQMEKDLKRLYKESAGLDAFFQEFEEDDSEL